MVIGFIEFIGSIGFVGFVGLFGLFGLLGLFELFEFVGFVAFIGFVGLARRFCGGFVELRTQIFYKTWQYVAHESMLPDPGDYVSLRLCDENVFVIRSADGELRAFYNVCRHRAHELLQGSGNVRKMIVCPYHAWSYNNQGELLRAPMSEHRPEFDKADFCLRAIRLEVFCGCIFINLDENCSSLHSIAGDLEKDIQTHIPYLDELKYCGSNLLGETRIDAGWKVVVDNYVECYHCRPAHKDLPH